MRTPLTISRINRLLEESQLTGAPLKAVPPHPYPGKRFPTRVAFRFFAQRAKAVMQPDGHMKTEIVNVEFEYVGKPNKLRAEQANAFIRKWGPYIRQHIEVEYDQAGLIAYKWRHLGADHTSVMVSPRYYVYHPQANSTLSILEGFRHEQFMKRLGGFSVYSFQKKLPIEQVDNFYGWYKQVFGKQLRRPKGKPLAQSSAEALSSASEAEDGVF